MKPAHPVFLKLAPVYLFFLIILTYGSLVFCDFTSYDDAHYVFQNVLIRTVSAENLSAIFFKPQFFGYSPLSLLSFMIEHSFLGVNPLIYHLTNIFLHFFVSAAVFYLLRLLIRNDWGAWLGSSLFAVSPVHVETVAWISARKSLLCALFFFLSAICFVRPKPDKYRKTYYFSLVLYVLSLFSMVYAILLPAAFWIGEREGWWPKKGWRFHLPFWALSGMFVAIWLNFHPAVHLAGDGSLMNYSRLKGISFAALFYLIKIFIPVDLSLIYPRPYLDGSFFGVLYGHSPWILFFLLLTVILLRKKVKALFFGAAFYMLSVFPILPSFEHTNSMVQDHYAYIASFGVFLAVSVLFSAALDKGKGVLAAAVLAGSFLIVSLSAVSSAQCLRWKDTAVLASHSLSIFPRLAPAYWLRGEHFRAKKEYDRALSDFTEAIRLRPEVYVAYENRAKTWRELGREDLALADEHAIQALKTSGKWKAVY